MSEERIARIEAELERLKPSLSERLERLEKRVEEKPPGRWARFLKWMGPALPTFATGAVMLVLGYWIKDSVDIAIRQQTLQLSYVKEMKEQLLAMASRDAGIEDVERAAVLVAGFGKPAVLPLMNELRYGGNRALGAEAGLRSLAFMQPESVCATVLRVLQSPARPLGWEGHAAGARILAAGNCVKALPVLKLHEALLRPAGKGNRVDVSAVVADHPDLSQEKEWLKSLKSSIESLDGSRGRGT